MKKQKILALLMAITIVTATLPLETTFAATNNGKQSTSTIQEKDFFYKKLESLNKSINLILSNTPDSELTNLLYNPIIKNYLPLREFISKVGPSNLEKFYNTDETHKKFLTWLISNTNALNLYLSSGDPISNNQIDPLNIWLKIWEKDPSSRNGFNLKLAIATSLEHSKELTFWLDGKQKIDPVHRYSLYKDLNDKKELFEVFNTLDVTHLRQVINAKITDNDILWIRDYIKNNKQNLLSQDKIADSAWLIKYTDKNPYGKSIFGSEFYGTNPTFKTVLDYGGVCGSISHFGAMTSKAFGVPSMPVGQPGHCAFIFLNSKGKWEIKNNISGWKESNGGTLNPWSNGSKGYNSSYDILVEDASKDEKLLLKSEQFKWLGNASTSYDKAQKIRNIGIKTLPLNYGIWKDKIDEMLKNKETSTEEYRTINSEILSTFKNYPKPMADLLKKIKDKVIANDKKELVKYIISYKNTLKNVSDNDQKGVANLLLNDMVKDGLFLATFSFDGKNAGKLEGITKDIEYSLDGGKTYKTPTENSMKLSEEELKSITSENGILLKVKNTDTPILLSISKGNRVNISGNNDENLIFGIDKTMEFSTDEGNKWTKYNGENLPDLSKDVTILVRRAATSNKLPSDPAKVIYTANNKPEGLILHSDMEVISYSSQQDNGGQASRNSIDGNSNSFWHTKWDRSDKTPYVTIKLNKEYDISKLTYLPRQDSGVNGNVKKYNIYTSLDGINFTKVVSGEWKYNNKAIQSVTFNKTKAKYVKFEVTEGVSGFASIAELNLYTN